MRAILLERGRVVAKGPSALARVLPDILAEEANGLSPRIRSLLEDMRAEWRDLDARIKAFDAELMALARENVAARRLMEVPGIGPLTATALVAAIDNAQAFSCGRDLAAWVGLVPRQATTGGKPRLLGISKRGNVYLRRLLVHGARSVLRPLAKTDTPLGRWLRGLLARRPCTVAIVALANKLARIAWAVLARGTGYGAVQVATR